MRAADGCTDFVRMGIKQPSIDFCVITLQATLTNVGEQRMKKLWICIGIAFYGTLPLHAANMVSASAHANGISVTLQDLDLEDGVSPALMWGFDDFGSIERLSLIHI